MYVRLEPAKWMMTVPQVRVVTMECAVSLLLVVGLTVTVQPGRSAKVGPVKQSQSAAMTRIVVTSNYNV